MTTWQRTMLMTLGAALLAGCGGSGSTGLIAPEQAALAEVRRDGTCVTLEETITYCATDSPDAVSPDGASADGPLDAAGPAPTRTPTPALARTATPAAGPTGTAGMGSTATPAGGSTSSSTPSPPTPVATAPPTPCPAGTVGCPALVELEFVVRSLPESAVCVLAARPAGSSQQWATGAPVAAGGEEVTITPELPSDLEPGLAEVALLCFDTPPPALPPLLETLASADPDVVFVPAEPVTIAP